MANTGTAASYFETLCDGCRSVSGCTKTCSGCKRKRYSSEECQKRAWDLHIFECDIPNKKLKPYNYLIRAIREDVIPINPRLREEFGFNRADLGPEVGPDGSQRLFGLYVGLIKIVGVPAKTSDKWRKEGVLLEEVKKVYETVEVDFRGQYYPWLLRNEFVLDRAQPIPKSRYNPWSGAATQRPTAGNYPG